MSYFTHTSHVLKVYAVPDVARSQTVLKELKRVKKGEEKRDTKGHKEQVSVHTTNGKKMVKPGSCEVQNASEWIFVGDVN